MDIPDDVPGFRIVQLPEANTTEMVQMLCSNMDELFGAMRQVVAFSHGDVMSACLCQIIEAGINASDGDLDRVKRDIIGALEQAIGNYSKPDKGALN